jgi:ribonuclease HII
MAAGRGQDRGAARRAAVAQQGPQADGPSDRRASRRGVGREPLLPPPITKRRMSTFVAPGALSGRASVAPWHKLRLDPDFGEERDLWSRGYRFVAGVDEVGRGCLAGPVACGAVILPPDWRPEGLRDSKMLKAEERERLGEEIMAGALAWSVAFVEAPVIDRINILQSTLLAAQLAAARLPIRPDALILDGTLLLPDIAIHQRVVIDGDRLCASVAAASVVAKLLRDRLMIEMDSRYPGYDLASNKGYAAPEHRAGLKAHGIAPIHRLTFASVTAVEQASLWEVLDDEVDEAVGVAVGPGDEGEEAID